MEEKVFCQRLEADIHFGCRKIVCAGCGLKDCPHWAPPPVRVAYDSIDRCRKTRTFKTIEGARKWAYEMVGKDAEIGTGYAVSTDGVGKVMVVGTTLRKLFQREDAERRAE